MSDIQKIILEQIKQPLWDNWYIKEEIGTGASSVVYRIEAKRENRIDVSALKIEPIVADETLYADDEKRKAFLERKRLEAENETTIMYKLRTSPNIVLYEDETIKPFYSNGKEMGYYMLIRMEYLTCVRQLMRDGNFDRSQNNILKLAIDIGSGIKAAHDIGVIHRDIKPGNFFISESGTYKLGDFNISKKSVSAMSFAGTEGYIAPEIYYARYGTDGYTKQADIYSFGISLYCLLNDYQFPFGDVCLPEDAIDRRMNGEPLPPPKYASRELAAVILKACAFNTADRYQNIGDMLSDLRAVSEGRAIAPAAVQVQTPPPPMPNNNYQGQPAGYNGVPQNYNTGYADMRKPAGGQQYAQPQYQAAYRDKRKKNSDAMTSKILIGIVAGLLFVILAFVLLLALKGKVDDDSSDKSSKPLATTVTTTETEEETETSTTTTVTTTTTETTTTVTTTLDTNVKIADESITMEVGAKRFALITEYPDGSGESNEVWRTTDESVATVDGAGQVTGISEGECLILLTFDNNPAAEAKVKVTVTKRKKPEVVPDPSNTGTSNIANGGYACMDGSEMFYSDDNGIYRINGGNSEMILGAGAHYMNLADGKIYFCDVDLNNSLCSVNRDGSDMRVLRYEECYELTYYEGWLYFSESKYGKDRICRMRPDGSDYTRLADVKSWYLTINSGRIYFVNYNTGCTLDVMNCDGSDLHTLVGEETSDICIAGGRIYYSSDKRKRDLYSISFDGMDKVLVHEGYIKHTNIIGTKAYFTDSNNNLNVLDLNNDDLKVYSDLGYISYPVITENVLYARGSDRSVMMFDIQ